MVYSFYKWCIAFLVLSLAPVLMGASFVSADKPTIPSLPHPTYISITEINHNKTDQVVEITCKLFFDDLEKVLTELNKVSVDLTQPKDKELVHKFIGDYLAQHLKLKLDGKAVSIQYLGYEREREAAWCYLQVEKVLPFKKAEVFNNIFYQQFESQINILHVINNGHRKSVRLNNPAAQAVFEF